MKNNPSGAKKRAPIKVLLPAMFYLFIQYRSPVEQQLDLFPKTGLLLHLF